MPSSPKQPDPADGQPARLRVLLVTGLSGAGKSLALKMFEDLGYEAVDNLPLSLIGPLLDADDSSGRGEAIAISVDFRTRDFGADSFFSQVDALTAREDIELRVLFLDCDQDVLSRRFTETRRRHPLAEDRPVLDGIRRERALMAPVADRADLVIDTSTLSPVELRNLLTGHFRLEQAGAMTISVQSFSFRRGLPREADLVFDVRFLNNPHYVYDLRPLTGRDAGVGDYIAKDVAFAPFMQTLVDMLTSLLPHYQREGKSYLTVAVGCTGGRHRSVFVSEQLAERLRAAGREIVLRHRDLPPGENEKTT